MPHLLLFGSTGWHGIVVRVGVAVIRGSPPALHDRIGGPVQVMFEAPGNVEPLSKVGRLKVLATTAPQRLSVYPEAPTFTKLDNKDPTEVIWVGLWTTPDLPAAVKQKIREATPDATQEPELREAFARVGWGIGTAITPEAMTASLRTASERQAVQLKAIGFEPE
jgi:tripartite-type tricarboxylate transporter receptor subunit TctC